MDLLSGSLTCALSGSRVNALSGGAADSLQGSSTGVLEPSVGPPVVTPGSLVGGDFGGIYAGGQIEATGGVGPYTFALAAGSDPLPPGLTLNSDGTITGTPSTWVTTPTVYPFDVEATDADMTVSAPVAFSITVSKPAVFDGLLWGGRAADYNATSGTLQCFNDAGLQFTSAGGARPARDDGPEGATMLFAGSQNLLANNAVENTFDNLADATLLFIASNDADALVWLFGARNPTTNNAGPQLNTLTDGAGVYRIYEYRNGGTYIGRDNIPRLTTTIGTIGFTTKQNTASQQVGWKGSTSYTGTATIPNAPWLIGSNANFEARIGAAADGSFGFSGNVHAAFMFNKALTAGEMQALLEYLEDNVFWGTEGVTLW